MEQTMIFEKFYRGRNQRISVHGTGMGLAIAKAIVDLHGGTIGLTSQLGRGSFLFFSSGSTDTGMKLHIYEGFSHRAGETTRIASTFRSDSSLRLTTFSTAHAHRCSPVSSSVTRLQKARAAACG